MLTELYIKALLVNEDLADMVWEAWDKAEIDDQMAWFAWWRQIFQFDGNVLACYQIGTEL